MIFKAWKKPLSLLSIFSLLINQVLFVPLVLAEESTPSAQLVTTEASPSPAPSTTPEPTTTPIPSVSPEATASASPGASPTSSGTPVLVSDWQDVEGKAITKNNVALDHTYTAPQNSKVTVKFNKLPEISGKLIIKEIKLTADQMNQTGALSDIAYDISSSMTDGTFEYTLTLPTTKTQNVEVKSSEDGNSFVTLGGVSAQTDTLTITGLNHFTIFVVAGIITSPGPGSFIGEPFNESTASAVINEFSYDPSSGQSEWIEILNKTGNDIDLSGWTVSDTANHVRDLSGTLPANGLVVYTNTGDSWMNDTDSSGDGDTIYLKNGADTIDEVTYQQQANNTVIDNTSDVGSVSSGNSVYRTSDGGSSWITGTPTKGWFNSAGQEGAAPLLSDIDSQLYGDESSEEDRVDSNIGELENPSNTPEGDSGLYFEVAGEGKIIFTASLNLTNQATVVVLQSLGQKMEMTDGHLEFDSQTASDMAVTGAKLYMYGINNLGYSSENQPNVIVSDDSGDEIYDDDENYPIIPGSLVYDPNVNDGQIVFDAAHFTQFDVENLNADTTSPDISSVLIDPVVDFDYLKGTVRVSANVTDDTGVSSVNFDFYNYWDIGEPEASCEGEPDENGVWSCSIDTTPLSEDLSYYLQVTAYDAAGNSSNNYYYTDWGSDELYADNAAPQTSDSGTDSDWHNSDVTVTLDCSDYSSGCSNTYYTTDGSDPTTSSSTGNEVILTENGEYTIKYFSDDYAGNQEEIKTVANTVKIDKTAPSGLGTTSTSPNPTTSTTQTWTWSAATDTLSGIAQYIWRVGELGSSTTDTSVETNLLEGIWDFFVKVQDSLGNESEETSSSVTVDTTAPTVITQLGDNSTDYKLSLLREDPILFGATLVFSEELSTASKTAVEDALTAGADKTLTFRWGSGDISNKLRVSTSDATTATFTNDVVVSVSDLAGNSAELLLVDSKLEDTQTVPETAEDGSGDATLNDGKPEVVITDPDQDVDVTVDSGTDNPTINVSSFITDGVGDIPKITIISNNASNVEVAIPATTVTSADAAWDGVIAAPTVTAVTLPETSGETKTLSTAIEIGFTGAKLSFDKAVRILLPNQAGKRVGYVRTGIDFTEIISTCSADNQATGDALFADGDCKIDVGSDLVIWTRHFTKFATYTQTTNSTSSSSSSSNSSPATGWDGGDGLGCAVRDCSVRSTSTQNQVPVVLTQPVAAGFAQGILGITSNEQTEDNVGIGQVEGISTPSTAQEELTVPLQPQTEEQKLPFNVKVAVIVVAFILAGFGLFKLLVK